MDDIIYRFDRPLTLISFFNIVYFTLKYFRYMGIDCGTEEDVKFGEILQLKNATASEEMKTMRESYEVVQCPVYDHPMFEINHPFKQQQNGQYKYMINSWVRNF